LARRRACKEIQLGRQQPSATFFPSLQYPGN
jgi:hypothetical protein